MLGGRGAGVPHQWAQAVTYWRCPVCLAGVDKPDDVKAHRCPGEPTEDRVGTWMIAWNNQKTGRFAWVTYENTTRANAETKWRQLHSYIVYERVKMVTL